MPEAFDRCEREGGKIITVKPKGREDTYIHVCYPKGGGSPIHGEVKKVKDPRTGKPSKG
jgi:hypothetical protein